MSVKYDSRRIRGRLRPVGIERMFRLILRKHRHCSLAAAPAPSRFSDPKGHYAVLYAAQSVRCGFWEGLIRSRFTRRMRYELPRADVEARLVVSLRSNETLNLVDLGDDGPIRIGAPTAVVHDSNHVAGRALSAAAYADLPEADGFLFPSRFTGDQCVAIFDRAIGKLEALEITPLIEHTDFWQAMDDYEITLLAPPV